VNTYHGDTEGRSNIGLLYEALAESPDEENPPHFMTYEILRDSESPWWVLFFRRSSNA
jgi:hypothetical protein